MSRDKPSLVSRLPKFGYGGAAKSRGPDDAAAGDDGEEKRSRPSLASTFGFRGKKNDVARRPTASIAAPGDSERREAEPAPRAAPDADAANGGPGSDDRGAARPPPVRSPSKPRVARQAFGFAGPARTTRAPPVRPVAEELREASEDRHRARSSSDCERRGAGAPGECRSRTESLKSEAGSSSSLGDDGFPPETALTRAQSFSHALASPAAPASIGAGQLPPLAGQLQRSKSMSKALQAQPGHGGAASRYRFGRPNNVSQPNLTQAGRTRPRGAGAARAPGPLRGPARSSPADADEAPTVASIIPSSALKKPRLPGFAAPGANGRAAAGRGGPLAAKPASLKPGGAPGAGIGARAESHAGGAGGDPDDVAAADGGVQVDSESPPEEVDRSETASLQDSESSETIAPLHGAHDAVCHDTVPDPAEVTGSAGSGGGGVDDGKAGDADDPVDRSDADPAGDGEEPIGRRETDGSGASVDRNSPDASRREPSCELDDDDLMLELDFPDEASLLAAATEAEGTDGVRAAEMRGHGREARREARSHWRSHGGRSVDGGTSAAVASPGAGIPPRPTGGPHARSPAPPGETTARDGSAGPTWRSDRGDGDRFFSSNANAAGITGAGLDPAFLRHLVQDCTGMKTLLLKLKRALQEDEELVSGSRTQTSLNCQSEGQEKTHDKDAATDEVTRLRGQLRAKEEENARLQAELARLRPDGVAGPDGVAEPGAAATEEKSTQTERRRRSSLKPSPPPSAQGSSAAGNPQRPALTGDPSDANGAAPPRAAEGTREAACREDELSALLSAKLRIDEGDGVRDAPPVAGRPSGRFTVAQHRACRPPWPQHDHRGHGQTQAPPGPPPLDEPRAPFVSGGDERLRRGDPPDAAAPSVAVRPRPRAPLAWDAPGVPPAAFPGHPAAPAAAIPGRQTHRPAAFAGERGPPPRPPGTQEDGGAFPAAPGAPGGAWGLHAVPSAGAGRDDAEPHRGAEGGARPGPVPRHGRRATGPQSRLPKPRS